MSEGARNEKPAGKGLEIFIAVTTVFFGLLIWESYRQGHSDERDYATYTDRAKAMAVCSGDKVNDGTCVIDHIDAQNHWQHEAADLHAQQDMAEWALLMFLATLAGVVYIALTLGATRDAVAEARNATWAAEKSVKETRRIGEAQTRAYLLVERAWITQSDENDIRIRAKIKNFGQTPAIDARSWISIWVESIPLLVELPEPSQDLPIGQAAIGPTFHHEFDHCRGLGLRACEASRIRTGQGAIYVYGEIRYLDMFRKSHTTKFCFFCSGRELFDNKRLAPYVFGNEID